MYQANLYQHEAPQSVVVPVSTHSFLTCLAEGQNGPISAADVAVVVAHPDDEAVGLGGQLARLRNLTVVHVTDGAPENLAFARKRGLETREEYAEVREQELSNALSLCGISQGQQVCLGIRDQQAAFRIEDVAHRLVDLFTQNQTAFVLTHPYEGGHPDHDATAVAVHLACRILDREGGVAPKIIEMASYFAGESGAIHQKFVPNPTVAEVICHLNPVQSELKRQVMAAHLTQAANMSLFESDTERFRPAPAYDFATLPNNGNLHYESFESGMTGERWLELAATALAQAEMLLAA